MSQSAATLDAVFRDVGPACSRVTFHVNKVDVKSFDSVDVKSFDSVDVKSFDSVDVKSFDSVDVKSFDDISVYKASCDLPRYTEQDAMLKSTTMTPTKTPTKTPIKTPDGLTFPPESYHTPSPQPGSKRRNRNLCGTSESPSPHLPWEGPRTSISKRRSMSLPPASLTLALASPDPKRSKVGSVFDTEITDFSTEDLSAIRSLTSPDPIRSTFRSGFDTEFDDLSAEELRVIGEMEAKAVLNSNSDKVGDSASSQPTQQVVTHIQCLRLSVHLDPTGIYLPSSYLCTIFEGVDRPKLHTC